MIQSQPCRNCGFLDLLTPQQWDQGTAEISEEPKPLVNLYSREESWHPATASQMGELMKMANMEAF